MAVTSAADIVNIGDSARAVWPVGVVVCGLDQLPSLVCLQGRFCLSHSWFADSNRPQLSTQGEDPMSYSCMLILACDGGLGMGLLKGGRTRKSGTAAHPRTDINRCQQ